MEILRCDDKFYQESDSLHDHQPIGELVKGLDII
jgi:hypothetical protein